MNAIMELKQNNKNRHNISFNKAGESLIFCEPQENSSILIAHPLKKYLLEQLGIHH